MTRYHRPPRPLAPAALALLLGALGLCDWARAAAPRHLGTAYARAHASAWLSHDRVAIGRWDGTITFFDVGDQSRAAFGFPGPEPWATLLPPARRGVQMVLPVGTDQLLSSNGDSAVALWRVTPRPKLVAVRAYPEALGTAVTAATCQVGAHTWVALGHQSGMLSVWRKTASGLSLANTVSLRSPAPLASRWPTRELRGLAPWRPGFVVAGSEDGDLSLIALPQGDVVARRRYHPDAGRGINAVAVLGDRLLVGSCPVGAEESNLWLFRISSDGFELLDHRRLASSSTHGPVFTFSVVTYRTASGAGFAASTEEGLLWTGVVAEERIVVDPGGPLRLTGETGGAALAVRPSGGRLVAAGHAVHAFAVDAEAPPADLPGVGAD